jgi:hypothetical protein
MQQIIPGYASKMDTVARMQKFKLMIGLFGAAILIGLVWVGVPPVGAQSAVTTVVLQPVDGPPGTLTLDVLIKDVANLYGAEFKLIYDPAILAARDANPDQTGVQLEAGPLLPATQGFVVANLANPADGSLIFAVTLLNPAPPVSGSGPLARLSFDVLNDKPTTITVEQIKLVSFDLQTIPVQTPAFAFNAPAQPAPVPAEFAPAATAAGAPFPWWLVAALIMLLGILALGSFIVMGEMKPAAEDIPPDESGRDQSPLYPTGAPSRVLKNR